jgi:hypothetical protein
MKGLASGLAITLLVAIPARTEDVKNPSIVECRIDVLGARPTANTLFPVTVVPQPAGQNQEVGRSFALKNVNGRIRWGDAQGNDLETDSITIAPARDGGLVITMSGRTRLRWKDLNGMASSIDAENCQILLRRQ